MSSSEPYRLWAGDDTTISGLQCLFQPKCYFDGSDMKMWLYKPARFRINDGDDEPKSHAIDFILVCPECGNKEMFGVAISKEHYEHIQKWIKRNPKRIVPRFVNMAQTV